MYTLDTNAIIYYLKDEPIATPLLRDIFAQPAILYISAITEIELFGFPFLASEEQKQIEDVLQTIVIIPVDSRVARAAASLRREYRLKIPDSAVAATRFLPEARFLHAIRRTSNESPIYNYKIFKLKNNPRDFY